LRAGVKEKRVLEMLTKINTISTNYSHASRITIVNGILVGVAGGLFR
jgi:hypothetical protein